MKSPQSNELRDFLLSRQEHGPASTIDWEQRRREWINAVKKLYHKVTGELLADSIEQRLVTVSRANKELKEEYLGKYRVPELVLDINGETVRFSPKGRNIIGAKGRVDLVGDLDSNDTDPRTRGALERRSLARAAARCRTGRQDISRGSAEGDALRHADVRSPTPPGSG